MYDLYTKIRNWAMSLYLGNANAAPVLHITNSSTDLATIRTTGNLSNTSFNSHNSFLSVTHLTRLINPVSFSAGYNRLIKFDVPTEYLDLLLNTTDWIGLGVDPYGNGNTMLGEQYWSSDYMPVESREDFKLLFHFDDSDAIFDGIGCYLGNTDDNTYVEPTSSAYIDIYTYRIITPTGAGIALGRGNVQIGDVNLLDHSFLNMFKANDGDMYYGSVHGIDYQVLNSTQVDGSLSLRGDALYSVTPSNEYLKVFGGTIINTTMYQSLTTFSDVLVTTLPSEGMAIVSLSITEFDDPLPARLVILNLEQSKEFSTYYYYTGPSDFAEVTFFWWVVYDSSNNTLKIEARDAYSDPNDYYNLEITGTCTVFN